MLGAVLRSDARDYGEIAKAGFYWGLIFGVLAFFGSFLISGQYPLIRALGSLLSSIVGMVLAFIIGAGLYDLSNIFIDKA